MSVLDFLFGGQAPASTTTYGTSTTNVPQWYSDYTQGLISSANAIADLPYQTYGGPRVAGFTQPQTQAFDAIKNMQGAYQSPLNQGIGFATAAGNSNPLGAANPLINQGAGLIRQATTDPTSLMNPYVNNVINNAGVLAGQNFTNNILPAIQSNFARAGQYGSAGMQRAVGQQVNQTQQALQSQAQAALAQAYQQAQQSGMSGGTALAQLGANQGQLAALNGQLQLGAGQQLGALAQAGQQLGLQGAAALEGVGSEQQQLNQTNLNTAYQDWLNQTQYPQNQLNWLSAVIRGQQLPTSSTNVDTTVKNSAQPSTLSQILGGINTLKDTWSTLFGNGG